MCTVTVISEVTGVTLDRTTATIRRGESITLTTTVTPSNATYKDIVWTSSNTNVATIDRNRQVTAIAAGTATITVITSSGIRETCIITVTK